MSNYNNSPRFTRPTSDLRPGPRFNTGANRHAPRNNFNSFRPRMANTTNQPAKPPSETNTPVATPPTNPSSSNPNTTTASNQPVQSEPTTTSISSANKPTETPSTNTTSEVTSANASTGTSGQKRAHPTEASSTMSFSTAPKTSQGGRSRLFVGNIPSDLTQDEFQRLFNNYGELVEYYVNPSRGFGFIKLTSRQIAERAKQDLDGHILRGKPLRVRFASQGAMVKVKNLSLNVSNELLKDAFEKHFGSVERAVVIVDDRGKSIGEGIVEFEKKPGAQKCLNECTERCFFITGELKPIVVEPWDSKDEEDGLPEKSLTRNDAYFKERELKPRFAEMNTIEHTIGLKWKELELQEKQLLEEVKRRMQFASEQLQGEIDQMFLEHQAQMLREELTRRQEDLRRIDERRSQEFDRQRQMIPMHHPDAFNPAMGNPYHGNQASALPYNDFSQAPYANANPYMQPSASMAPTFDPAYTTHHVAHGQDYNNQQMQGYNRKRPRH